MNKKYILILFLALSLVFGCNSNKEAQSENSDSTVGIDNSNKVNPYGKFGIDDSKGVPTGLAVGDKVSGFAGRDIFRETVDLYSILKTKPVVIVFYRGKWCPNCNRHISNFSDSVKFIMAKGVHVIAITPETIDNAKEFAKNTEANFSIFSDPGGNIMRAYKVAFSVTEEYQSKIQESHNVSIAANNGADNAKLPVPATYIISKEGIVEYVHFDMDYKNRASVKEILKQLDAVL
ncbi:MAG: AhpC/TSA family protein [Cyclobacteriaceae bacterium]|nr:AhpC/TSA family protein [Cyclobacteriaceae bacterium]